MFLGTVEHTMDGKGRVSIPARFRDAIENRFGDKIVMTKGEGCVDVYPVSIWQELTQKIMGLPQLRRDIKAFQRFYIGGAQECSIDKQGRVLVPPDLRLHAGFDKDVVFIGISTRFELWSKKNWMEAEKRILETIDGHRDALAELGI